MIFVELKHVGNMKVTKDNLIDTLQFYIEDNELDYLSIRASVSVDGSLLISIFEDIEDE